MVNLTTQKPVTRMRHELKIRDVSVTAIRQIDPHFIAITFYSADFDHFISASFDDHVKFVFNLGEEQVRRDFTPTRYDAANKTLTLQFALHDTGKATQWAKNAKVGDKAVIGGPRGSVIVNDDLKWQLLIGDHSALPAIERRLNELAADKTAIVLLLIADSQAIRDLPSNATTDIHWCYSEEELLHTLAHLTLPSTAGFSWAAGEASLMQQVKTMLTGPLQQPSPRLRIGAYWRKGEADFHQQLMDE